MPNQKKNPPKFKQESYPFILLVGLLFSLFTVNYFGSPKGREIHEGEFKKLMKQGFVERVSLIRNKYYIKIQLKNKKVLTMKIANSQVFDQHYQELQKQLPESKRISYYIEDDSTLSNIISSVIIRMIVVLILSIILMYLAQAMMKDSGGGMLLGIGKSKADLWDEEEKDQITFKDVAGMEEEKEEIEEIIEFLKYPKRFLDLGAKIPKGILLEGPPGTGKTLLARAVAGEAKVPFFFQSGSAFVEMFVGVGASRVRDLFEKARKKGTCIIFIDEIDAIGGARGRGGFGANDEREATLNQLLSNMDGISSDPNTHIIVIGATNRASMLDPAIVRPGRLDRKIYVGVPKKNDREAIFNYYLKKLKISVVDIKRLAEKTPGFTGADIAHICNEAALFAARKKRKKIIQEDFYAAIDRSIGGIQRKKSLASEAENQRIAYHEGGHVTVQHFSESNSDSFDKVTIIPRGRALGFAQYIPEEKFLNTKEEIESRITVCLGGRAAEQIIFNNVTTGASDDLQKAKILARRMVKEFGMGDKSLQNISYSDNMEQSQQTFHKPYSEETERKIDENIERIVQRSYKRALSILQKNKNKLIQLAEKLLEKEELQREDVHEILGPRPYTKHVIKSEEEEKLKDSKKVVKKKVEKEKKISSEGKDLKSKK